MIHFLTTRMSMKWTNKQSKSLSFKEERSYNKKSKQSDLLLFVAKNSFISFVHFCMWTRETWVTHSFEKCLVKLYFLSRSTWPHKILDRKILISNNIIESMTKYETYLWYIRNLIRQWVQILIQIIV